MGTIHSRWAFGGRWRRGASFWRRDGGLRAAPRRWSLAPEPCVEGEASFPGAAALRDVEAAGEDAEAVMRAVARLVVLQFVDRAVGGGCEPGELAGERAGTAEYVARAWGAYHPGRIALERALRAPDLAVVELCDSLRVAGDDAAGEGHGWGARALLRTSYDLALTTGCLAEAARAAGSMAVVAEARGCFRSSRLWSRRARVIARAARAAGE